MPNITFLTRHGCGQSPVLSERLRMALAACGVAQEPGVIDVADLATEDVRTGYGTPTVLVGGQDLFGMDEPAPAPPS